ncbi:MAG: hypothetical protein HY908_15875 [Myxococcales bacterium]|nr:hypothetical protein [Myxococcales bacterium]
MTTADPPEGEHPRHARLRLDLAWGALGFGVGAPSSYMFVRLWERWRDGEGDPGLVLRTAHTGFVWRSIIALWGGLLVGALAHTLSHRAALRVGSAPEVTSTRALRGEHRTAVLLALVLGAVAALAAFFP